MMTVRHRFATFGSAALLTCSVSVAAQERPNGVTAQPTIAAPATLDALVAEQAREDAANRQVVRDVLDRREIREVARQAGLDLERARQGVATLTSDELREIADQARRVDASLSGGASTLVISTTTIIIILLVVILIIVAVD
jgi:hypothetical protein